MGSLRQNTGTYDQCRWPFGGGISGFGKSKAKRFHKGDSELTFDNVAELENAKRDLSEITGYLKNFDHYRELEDLTRYHLHARDGKIGKLIAIWFY